MNSLLTATLSYLLLYKYIALFLIVYLSSIFIPLPENTALMAMGAFAGQGYMNIYLILLVAIVGNILGDLTGFILARRYGKEFLIKIGLRKVIISKNYINLEKFIDKNYVPTIFISRFIGQIGPIVNILSGLSDISFNKFLIYDSIAEFIYVSILSLSGYFLGGAWQDTTKTIEYASIGIILIITGLFLSKRYFKINKTKC